MADQSERPGEAKGMRGRADEDTEGHKRYFRASDTDEPPSDEADAEGHKRFFRASDTDEPPSDEDTEGHMPLKRGAMPEGDEPKADQAEAEGHGIRPRFGTPEGDHLPGDEGESDDSEGHAGKFRV
jgi:hypothetical protein